MKNKNTLKIGDRVFVDVEPMINKPPHYEYGEIVYFNYNGDPVIEFDKQLQTGQMFGAYPANLVKKEK